jgi:hypothetical protein
MTKTAITLLLLGLTGISVIVWAVAIHWPVTVWTLVVSVGALQCCAGTAGLGWAMLSAGEEP